MKIISEKKYLFMILMAALTTGFFIESQIANKGIIVLSQLVLSLLMFIYIFTNHIYSKKWIISSSILVLLLLFNGSKIGSILLVGVVLVLAEVLRSIEKVIDIKKLLTYKYLYVYILIILSFALIALSSNEYIFWTPDSKIFPLERLKLLMSEPSYLGMLLSPLLLYDNSFFNKIALYILMLLTQSYLAFSYVGFLKLLTFKKGIYVIIIIGIITLYYLVGLSFHNFFVNSGMVRLVGITLFTNHPIEISTLFFGHGLGAGDFALTQYFNDLHVKTANGFIFSAFYDIGIVGIGLYLYALGRNKLEYIILLFLLLNFGLGDILVPIILYLSRQLLNFRT